MFQLCLNGDVSYGSGVALEVDGRVFRNREDAEKELAMKQKELDDYFEGHDEDEDEYEYFGTSVSGRPEWVIVELTVV